MRTESFMQFVELVVQEYDKPLYEFIVNAPPTQFINMDAIFDRFALQMYTEKTAGKLADYVREIAAAKLEGALVWTK